MVRELPIGKVRRGSGKVKVTPEGPLTLPGGIFFLPGVTRFINTL
jgi:hypothetical protein